jgi:hypothetical protein
MRDKSHHSEVHKSFWTNCLQAFPIRATSKITCWVYELLWKWFPEDQIITKIRSDITAKLNQLHLFSEEFNST